MPVGTTDKYTATAGWKKFLFIEEGTGGGGGTPEKCATPTIAIKDGKLSFSCETEGVEFNYTILPNGALSGKGNDLALTPSFTVNVYASKDGYEDSDVATETINIIKGDVDGDGVVDLADAVRIINFYVGKVQSLAPSLDFDGLDPQ